MSTSNSLTKNLQNHVVIKPSKRSKLDYKKGKKMTAEQKLTESKEVISFKSYFTNN